MKLQTFLKHLKATKKKRIRWFNHDNGNWISCGYRWHLDEEGHIVAKQPNYSGEQFCPITAVYHLREKVAVSLDDYKTAAFVLGIDSSLADFIASAADNLKPLTVTDVAIRAKILKVLNLKEKVV